MNKIQIKKIAGIWFCYVPPLTNNYLSFYFYPRSISASTWEGACYHARRAWEFQRALK